MGLRGLVDAKTSILAVFGLVPADIRANFLFVYASINYTAFAFLQP